MVTNSGLGLISGRIKGSEENEPKYIAFGTGTTETAATMADLVNPASEARVAGTTSITTTTTANDTYFCTGLITCESVAKAITEVGLFTAASDGTMLMRSNFDVINLNPNDSITFNISVQTKVN